MLDVLVAVSVTDLSVFHSLEESCLFSSIDDIRIEITFCVSNQLSSFVPEFFVLEPFLRLFCFLCPFAMVIKFAHHCSDLTRQPR